MRSVRVLGRHEQPKLPAVLLAALAVLVAALFAGGARSARADARLIAFARSDGIYVIGADGSGERALRRGGAAAGVVRLAWSPDGRRIAFTNGRNEVWAMRADGSGLVRLVTAAEISAKVILGPLAWLPDGRGIAFTAIHRWSAGEKTREWDIYRVNADGTGARRLLETPGVYEFEFDWAPTADRLAVTDLNGMVCRLRVLNTSGRILRTVNPGLAYELAMPDWAPDGRRLAFMGWPLSVDRSGGGSLSGAEIWVMSASGHWRRLTWNKVVDSNPAWSPDGRKIAFLRDRGANTVFLSPQRRGAAEIYVMNADGSGVTRLTYDDAEETSPAWQPSSS